MQYQPRFCTHCATPLALLTQAEDGGDKERLRCPACGWTHWNNPTPVLAAIVEVGGKVLLARNAAWPVKMFALITGFMAKESVVSTLGVLFGTSSISSVLTPLSAASLLAFCLLYTPCVAAITSVKRELGTMWAIWVVIFQCVVAWIVAFIVHTIGMIL